MLDPVAILLLVCKQGLKLEVSGGGKVLQLIITCSISIVLINNITSQKSTSIHKEKIAFNLKHQQPLKL